MRRSRRCRMMMRRRMRRMICRLSCEIGVMGLVEALWMMLV
jgi:hypothetical protein